MPPMSRSRGFSDAIADILRPVVRAVSSVDANGSDTEEAVEVLRRLIKCEDHMGFLEGIGSLKMRQDLETICRASYESRHARKAIMEQLAWGLSRSAAWRESYSSLLVLEALASTGSRELWRECAVGMHFDVTQRIVLFGHFTSEDDPRVTRMMRAKAEDVRDLVTERYRVAEEHIRKYGYRRRRATVPGRNGYLGKEVLGRTEMSSSSSSSEASPRMRTLKERRNGYNSVPLEVPERLSVNGSTRSGKKGLVGGFARPGFTIETSESEGSSEPEMPSRASKVESDLLDVDK
ncbi:hypothetical protein FOL47_011187 [Perkinsus chesapeaki]|uniref:ENTH domain-containing protein n=1 Tax=Perkinsus chesapeaki TaxID=330153 RepID=A0A7J6L0R1_PERCH|nr:hypothetical protein FOL47_011187 [Perkinsus chesapeaki]